MLIYIYGLPVLEQMYSLPDGCDRTPLFTSSVCLAVSLAVYSVQCTTWTVDCMSILCIYYMYAPLVSGAFHVVVGVEPLQSRATSLQPGRISMSVGCTSTRPPHTTKP